jgi:hypothetical protein
MSDTLEPGDLLSDDPDGGINHAAVRARVHAAITVDECGRLRDALRDSDKTAWRVASGMGLEITKSGLRNHYRGRCGHDTDADPVAYDYTANRWTDA